MATPKYRMTPQRRVILEELRKVHSHPTADKVYEMVLRRLPRISLGTVYRNLEILSECGIIQKLELASKQKRFDSNTESHYHLRCICCGRVDDAPIKPLTSIEDSLKRVSDYRILGHQLEFIGLCPDCKEEELPTKVNRVNRKEGQ